MSLERVEDKLDKIDQRIDKIDKHLAVYNSELKFHIKRTDMLEQELINEFDNGVRMFGYDKNNMLVGVMGIQELKNVTLIRHAYTLSNYQGIGIGKSLLQYLFKINNSSNLYVGTWQDATWAIKFYEKSGFILHKRKQTVQLLKKYWEISSKQIENSVVLEKIN